MNTKQIIIDIARSLGYKSRSNYLWSLGTELVGVVYLQRSMWSDSYYFEGGLIERSFFVREHPPFSACWGISRRFSALQSVHQSVFVDLEIREPPYDPIKLNEGILWALLYIKTLKENPEFVRKIVLGEIAPEFPELWRSACEGSHIVDWARGVLGSPAKYFPVVPAYFSEKISD